MTKEWNYSRKYIMLFMRNNKYVPLTGLLTLFSELYSLHREIFEIFQKYFTKYFMKYFTPKISWHFTSLASTKAARRRRNWRIPHTTSLNYCLRQPLSLQTLLICVKITSLQGKVRTGSWIKLRKLYYLSEEFADRYHTWDILTDYIIHNVQVLASLLPYDSYPFTYWEVHEPQIAKSSIQTTVRWHPHVLFPQVAV